MHSALPFFIVTCLVLGWRNVAGDSVRRGAAQTIRGRIAQADRDEGRRTAGLSTAESEELRKLRRENKRLREERGGAEVPLFHIGVADHETTCDAAP